MSFLSSHFTIYRIKISSLIYIDITSVKELLCQDRSSFPSLIFLYLFIYFFLWHQINKLTHFKTRSLQGNILT